jgi:predicted TIM-barrel fold metal-dependent hydrolase
MDKKTAGINEEIFRWMLNSAKQVNLPVSGYYGGILHDEAKIQEDLVIKVKGGTNELIGWVDTGNEGDNLRILKEQNVTKKLATDVLQKYNILGITISGAKTVYFKSVINHCGKFHLMVSCLYISSLKPSYKN